MFGRILSFLGRKTETQTKYKPSEEAEPQAFALKMAATLPRQSVENATNAWLKSSEKAKTRAQARKTRCEARLEDPEFVEKKFKEIIEQRGVDSQTFNNMMAITYNTKVALVRQNFKSQHPEIIDAIEKEMAEEKENIMVRQYQEAGIFVPAKASPGASQPIPEASQQLKRKRSSLSLHRVKSFGELKRQKLRTAVKKLATDKDTDSTHSSMVASETNLRPRSASQSIKDFFAGSLLRRNSTDSKSSRTSPRDSCDSADAKLLPVIAKDEDEDETQAADKQPAASDDADASIEEILLHSRKKPLQFCPDLKYLIQNHIKDSPSYASDRPPPAWDPKRDVLINEISDLPDYGGAQEHIEKYRKALRDMMHYFWDSSSDKPEPHELGCLAFEEILRDMQMFVNSYSAARVKLFADMAVGEIMWLVQLLANREYRPAHETKTLRALLSIFLGLVKLPAYKVQHMIDNKKTWAHGGKLLYAEPARNDTFFKSLIEMKFSHGEERRGFSNFGDRRLVIEVMSSWVTGPDFKGSTQEKRARLMLEWFRDPVVTKTHDFLEAMHNPRPYNRWYRELRYSTEGYGGVSWIWHNKGNQLKDRPASRNTSYNDYYHKFKPIPTFRPDQTCSSTRSHTETLVTCYIAATIDFMTTLVASLPEREERRTCRADFEKSGFNDIFLSRFLRASKHNFAIVHKALDCWYEAAHADGHGWPRRP